MVKEEGPPVPKSDHLETEEQQPYIQWIKKILGIDRRTSKDPRLYCAYCDMNTILDYHASMFSSIRSQMRGTDAHCAQAITLHFYAQRHRSMVAKARPIGTRLSTSVQSKMVENLIIDEEKQSLMSMSILPRRVLSVQLKIHSRSVQQPQ